MIRSALVLLLAFIVSTFVGGMVATQLAVAFDSGEEFIATLMLLAVIAIVAIVAFGVALALSKSVSGIDWTALGLLVIVVLTIAALALIGAGSVRALTVSPQDLPILAEIAVPAAVTIGIQWWLMRRRWRRARAAEPAAAAPGVL